MFRTLRTASCLLATALSASTLADDIQIPFNGLHLNADLALAEGKTLEDGVLLLTHGTLAHNKMELIETLQSLLVDYGISTLSINLSYGLDDRESAMYDCSVPANHRMNDAIAEISAWQDWLDLQDAGPRWLMGHSRGGNQVAQYTASDAGRVSAQILLAPATWSYEDTLQGYQNRYGQSIEAILAEHSAEPDDKMLESASILYCENSGATLGSLRSYYANNTDYDTPTVLQKTDTPTLVIAGSLDEVVADLPEKMTTVTQENVELVVIEDADHFFRDLFADEVADYVLEFVEAQ